MRSNAASPSSPPSPIFSPVPVGATISDNRRDELRRVVFLFSGLASVPLMVANMCGCLFYSDGAAGETNFGNTIFLAAYHAIVVALLLLVGTKAPGEFTMAGFFLLGAAHEFFGVGVYSHSASEAKMYHGLGPLFWCGVEIVTGIVCGVFCRSKDILDGRATAFRSSIAHRLNLLTPYIVGIWIGTMASAGWDGVFVVYASIFILLSVLGWGMFLFRLLRGSLLGEESGTPANRRDVLSTLAAVANASFGKVMFFGGGALAIVAYLLVPVVDTLARRLPHTMLGALGIMCEVATYDYIKM